MEDMVIQHICDGRYGYPACQERFNLVTISIGSWLLSALPCVMSCLSNSVKQDLCRRRTLIPSLEEHIVCRILNTRESTYILRAANFKTLALLLQRSI